MVSRESVMCGSQCDQLGQRSGSAGAESGSGLSVDDGAEARAVAAERAPLEPEPSDPVESGIAGVGEYDPSELVSSLLGALVGSSGSAACSVSAWMAEHNVEVEDWMASMSTGRQSRG